MVSGFLKRHNIFVVVWFQCEWNKLIATLVEVPGFNKIYEDVNIDRKVKINVTSDL